MSAQRADQRARILDAVQLVVFERGYLGTKIGDVASRAGVSRATFYELFESKEDCFLASHDQSATLASDRVAAAVAGTRGRDATPAAITALLELAEKEPHRFACLTHEATIAGSAALAKRERLLHTLGELITHAQAGETRGRAPDLPPRVLVGAAVRAAGTCLRRDEHDLDQLTKALLRWCDLYATPIGAHRWSDIEVEPLPLTQSDEPNYAASLIEAESPRGRQRLPARLIRRTQRERILRGTAAAVSAKGYEHTTVADIVAAAGISRDVFYAHMNSKRDALEQAAKLFFERLVATTAGAFFAVSASWSERVWRAGAAVAEFIAAAPTFARLALIDAYAPDAAAARHADELLLDIAVFIERCAAASPDGSVPPLAVRAILASLTEMVLRLLASDRVDELPGMLPLATYVTVVPFIGARPGNDFVQEKLAARRAQVQARHRT